VSTQSTSNRFRRRSRAVVRAVRSDERGLSLVLALLVITALSITTAGLATLITSNEHAFGRDRQEERAFNISEAGLNNGIAKLSTLNSASYAQGQTFTSGGAQSIDGGTYSWTATKTTNGASSDTWTIQSTGTNGNVTRNISVQVTAAKVNTVVPSSSAWAYGIFVGNPAGCTNVGGGVALTLSVFVLGDLCMNGSAAESILEPNSSGTQSVDLYVKGSLYLGNNPSVGTSSRRIRSATIVNGCFLKNVAKPACDQGGGNSTHVWASTYSTTPLAISKPSADAVSTYAGGDWQNPVCSQGSFTFDNDGTRNTSLGNFTLMTGSSYNCTVYKTSSHVAGNEEGTLHWDAPSKTLTISGTIYVDGNLAFNGGDNGKYTGFASLWVNGTVTTNGNSALCGPPSTTGSSQGTCSGTWDGAVGALTITAVNAGGAATGWQMNGTAEIDAAAYVNGSFSESGSAFVTGPVITDSAALNGTPKHTDITNPPPGTPGASTTNVSSTWGHVVKGSWRQIPN
jgi:Tfp pilus assembly protein PilX